MERAATKNIEAIVIGVSAGGLEALSKILSALPMHFPLPIAIVQHRAKDDNSLLEEILETKCRIKIKQADEKEMIRSSTVYFAPANYHLLVEKDRSFSLSGGILENYSRPSIDVLFETAADTFRDKLLGIILTGASNDGAKGIQTIQMQGGITIAQDPKEAKYPFMPQAAIDKGGVSHILTLEEIIEFLLKMI